MRLEEALHTALVAPSPQTAAEARVYPMIAPEGAALPRITFQRIATEPQNSLDGHARIATEPQNSLDGHARIDRVNVQIDCWASTKSGAAALALEVRLALANESFKPLVQNEYDGFEGESRLYRHTLDLSCWDKGF